MSFPNLSGLHDPKRTREGEGEANLKGLAGLSGDALESVIAQSGTDARSMCRMVSALDRVSTAIKGALPWQQIARHYKVPSYNPVGEPPEPEEAEEAAWRQHVLLWCERIGPKKYMETLYRCVQDDDIYAFEWVVDMLFKQEPASERWNMDDAEEKPIWPPYDGTNDITRNGYSILTKAICEFTLTASGLRWVQKRKRPNIFELSTEYNGLQFPKLKEAIYRGSLQGLKTVTLTKQQRDSFGIKGLSMFDFVVPTPTSTKVYNSVDDVRGSGVRYMKAIWNILKDGVDDSYTYYSRRGGFFRRALHSRDTQMAVWIFQTIIHEIEEEKRGYTLEQVQTHKVQALFHGLMVFLELFFGSVYSVDLYDGARRKAGYIKQIDSVEYGELLDVFETVQKPTPTQKESMIQAAIRLKDGPLLQMLRTRYG